MNASATLKQLFGVQDTDIRDDEFHYWRNRIFYSLYIGYVCFYLTRKSFTFAMPAMLTELSYTKADLGFLGSTLYITYGISKFSSGILSDRANPRYFMSIGLILTGICNLLFAESSSLILFAVIWGLNGFFQGWGLPPATKQIAYWFTQKERGFWWSIFSTSNNVGGALAPILVALILSSLNWKWAMYIPGVIGIVLGLFILERMRGTPQSMGFEVGLEEKKTDDNASAKELLWNSVLKNKAIWTLAFAFFSIFVIRTAISDWGALYLQQVKGYTLLESASAVSWFEVGGFFGCLLAGWGSDRFFNGHRIPYILFCAVATALTTFGFWCLPSMGYWVDLTLLALLGAFVFGPQMLVGLASAEFVNKKAACTASGFTGGFGYLGAAATGYPLGKMIDLWGWQGYFICLLANAAFLFVLLIPLAKASDDRRKALKPKFAFAKIKKPMIPVYAKNRRKAQLPLSQSKRKWAAQGAKMKSARRDV